MVITSSSYSSSPKLDPRRSFNFFLFEKWATFGVDSCLIMVGKNTRWCLGPKLNPSSSSRFIVFEKWTTFNAESCSNMVGKNPRWCSSSNLDPSNNSWFLFFLKSELLSVLKIVRLWWEKTQACAWVQNWTWTTTWVFFLLSKLRNFRCWELLEYGAKYLNCYLGPKLDMFSRLSFLLFIIPS